MEINDGVFVYYSLAEVQLRGTDHLHCVNECKELDSNREKAQRRSSQVEYYPKESRKSECRKDDIHGHRT